MRRIPTIVLLWTLVAAAWPAAITVSALRQPDPEPFATAAPASGLNNTQGIFVTPLKPQPSVTPGGLPFLTATVTGAASATATLSVTPTGTALPATATPFPTETVRPGTAPATTTTAPDDTPTPGLTRPTATSTSGLPVVSLTPTTPAPVWTPTPRATDWSPGGTATATPTQTATFTQTPTPAGEPTVTPGPDLVAPRTVVINEVAWGGTAASSADEWLELFNPGPWAVDLAGWMVSDGGDVTIHVSGLLPAGGFYLLERGDDQTVSDVPADQIYSGALNNSGESLTLLGPAGEIVDTVNGDGGAWPAGSAGPGYLSMERVAADLPDADSNWVANNGIVRNGHDAHGDPLNGTPRQPNSATLPLPTVTPTATASATPATGSPTATATPSTATPAASSTPVTASPTPTASATPTSTLPTSTASPDPIWMQVRLNEALPAPQLVDWNGDGRLDEDDEYIELYNRVETPIDLGGFRLDDVAGGGSAAYAIPEDTWLPGRGFLVFFRSQTRVALNNSGGEDVRLLAPSGVELQVFHYAAAHDDRAWSALPDGGEAWSEAYPPSPGVSNEPPAAPLTVSGAVYRGRPGDPREPLAGATVQLWAGGSARAWDLWLLNTLTGADGRFSLSISRTLPGLPYYHLVEVDPPGLVSAGAVAGPGGTVVDANWIAFGPTNGATFEANEFWDEAPWATPTALPPGRVLITEVEYDSVEPGNDGRWEWIELANTGDSLLVLENWSLADNLAVDLLPTLAITPGGYLVVAADAAALATHYPDIPARIVEVADGQLGNSLGNDGDELRLRDAVGREIDALSWGNNRAVFDPAAPDVAPGHSLARVDPARDTDTAADWTDAFPPSPGRAPLPVTPTPTVSATSPASTATASATPPPPTVTAGPSPTPDPAWAQVRLNEILPAPEDVDWNGDGLLNEDDEYIELYNRGDGALHLGGFQLDDVAGGGSRPYQIEDGTVLPAHGFLVFFRTQTGIALNNSGGDDVRLLSPLGSELQRMHYETSHNDVAWSALPDGGDFWSEGVAPSPGRSNCPDATCLPPTPTATRTATATRTPTRSPTPTPSATPQPQGTPGLLRFGEVLYDGAISGTEGDEFVELFNADTGPLDLGHYRVGDEETAGGNEGMYRLPAGRLLQPGEAVVVAKNAAAFRARFATWPDYEVRVGGSEYPDSPEVPNLVRDTAWGSGTWTLSNSGDEVILLDSEGRVVDALAFAGGDGAGLGLAGSATAREPNSLQRVGGADSDDLEADLRVALPNPGWVEPWPQGTETPALWGLPGGWSGVWGGLAAQSGYGEGEGPPAYVAARARAAGLRFVSLADPLASLDAVRWQRTLQAAEHEGDFDVLAGFGTAAFDVAGAAVLPAAGDEPLAWAAAHPGLALSAPGDTWTTRDRLARDLISLQTVDPRQAGEAQAITLPFVQAWGTGERSGLAPPAWQPGSAWRVGVVVRQADREGILEGLRGARTWVTSDPTLGLMIASGERWAGEVVSRLAPLPVTVHYRDDEAALLEVLVGARVVTQTMVAGSTSWQATILPQAGAAVWARALQADGDVAATSPLFVEGPANPPGVRLNEILPAPRADWNHDGETNTDDEWIELYNAGPDPVNLLGWQLTDRAATETEASRWRVPVSHWLAPGQFTLFWRSETGVSLNDSGDWIRLLDPQDNEIDALHYARNPGTNRSWARTLDGGGIWVNDMGVTLGEPNLPATPTPTPTPKPKKTATPTPVPLDYRADLAAARQLEVGARVVISGQVTAPRDLLGKDALYIQAGAAGIKVEFAGEDVYPRPALGERVEVRGRLGTARGELKLRVSLASDVLSLATATPPAALRLRSGAVGEAWEGTLVRISGRVTRLATGSLYLDDGSGEARVAVLEGTGFKRPAARRGQVWTVVGIVSQYGSKAPFTDGYRVLPRFARDMALLPAPEAPAVEDAPVTLVDVAPRLPLSQIVRPSGHGVLE